MSCFSSSSSLQSETLCKTSSQIRTAYTRLREHELDVGCRFEVPCERLHHGTDLLVTREQEDA